jgi:hypothetical protein
MNTDTITAMNEALDAFLVAARQSAEYAAAERKQGRIKNGKAHDADADTFRTQARAMRAAISAARSTR